MGVEKRGEWGGRRCLRMLHMEGTGNQVCIPPCFADTREDGWMDGRGPEIGEESTRCDYALEQTRSYLGQN